MSHVCTGETPRDLVLRFPACNAETKARGGYNPRVNTDPPQVGFANSPRAVYAQRFDDRLLAPVPAQLNVSFREGPMTGEGRCEPIGLTADTSERP
jgi:hypothetical protein